MSESLKEYLKRYESNNEQEKKKNKKKKKKNTKPEAAAGVSVVDEDPVWAKPVKLEEEEDDDSPDEKPQVDEDIEVKRLKRLEQVRARRPFNSIAEDGSGWVSFDKPSSHRRNDTPSPEPEPRRSRESEDMSPPRRQVNRDNASLDSDMSPPRKQRARSDVEDEDFSPPRRPRARARYDTPSPEPDESRASRKNVDLSPPRRKRNDVVPSGSRDPTRATADGNSLNEDLSPPRKKKANPSGPAASKEQPRTGLVSGRDISEEISRKKKDDMLRFQEMNADMSGKGAEPVYRGKKGERISKDEYLKSKEKKVEKPKEIHIEWGKGLAQKREAEAKLVELELEKEKPFARTRDDPQLDKMLKERPRWGDPMAHLVKNKQYEPDVSDLGDDDKMKASGFIIPQGIPNHSWLKRGLPAAPNRYGIKPGRHWDGVDRSSGYEKEMFKRTNDKQATEREAYLWSVADM
ncbi:unnamed protein product [Linum tenue]|uniref:BUD13 homolog n=1 Tax=Linum tenue TaxID=586396 RepID=A0AAV0IFC9_9ROSI|nr:unnamed protein product [Linum tenue]